MDTYDTSLPEWFKAEIAEVTTQLQTAKHWLGVGEGFTANALRQVAYQRAGVAGIRLGSENLERLGAALIGDTTFKKDGHAQ